MSLLFHFNLLNCQVDKPSKIDRATTKARKGTALVWKIYSLLLNLKIIYGTAKKKPTSKQM
jgi:hypothetical protein